MHPLPRVNELDASFDSDRRAVYFRQAAYGVPVRMALISLLLNLNKNTSLHKFPGGFAKPEHPLYAAADRHRHRLRQSKLHHQRSNRTAIRRPQILRRGAAGGEAQQAALPLLRDRRRSARPPHVVADTVRRTFSPGVETLLHASADKLKNVVIYPSEADARAAGFTPRESAKKAHG